LKRAYGTVMLSDHGLSNRRHDLLQCISTLLWNSTVSISIVMNVLLISGDAFGGPRRNPGVGDFPSGAQVIDVSISKGLNDPPSTLEGSKLIISQVMHYAYAAGFQSENQLLTATAIAISESGLFSAARNWHPEKGFRPIADVITVKGPKSVWSNGGQMHSDRGIWQIASFWFPEYSDVVVDSPQIAAIIAFNLSKSGTDFQGWDSYKSHNAQKLFDQPYDGWPALRPIVKRFLSRVNPPSIPWQSENSGR
jgi:hypothetical protein